MWIITNNISILIIPLWILKMLIHRILLIKEGTAMKLGRDYTPIINRGFSAFFAWQMTQLSLLFW